MTIEYSCISRGTVVLCSRQNGIGSFESTVDSILPNIPANTDGKNTYTSNDYAFHCVIESGLIYLCAASPNFGKQQPYSYLTEVKKKFQTGPLFKQAKTAESHDFDGDFGFVMHQLMEKYSKQQASSGVMKLQSQVDEVKGVMSQNIEKVLERGERLDDLMDKTEELEAGSASFQKTARRIQKKYWWKNTKMTLILIAVVLVVIIIIVVAVCASTGVFNKSDGSSSTPSVQPTTASPTGR